MSDSDDDDIPRLSSHTLAALQEFYSEQKQQSDPGGDDKYNIGIIEENWVSQCLPRLTGSSGVVLADSAPAPTCLHLSSRSAVSVRPPYTRVCLTCPSRLCVLLSQKAVHEHLRL